jgi:hypothetical protein
LHISRTPKKHILRVHKKLGEAAFFLGKMTKQEGPRGDSDRFDYYLSAFFSAAMSARGNAIKGWGAQWKANLSDEEKSLYKFMGKGGMPKFTTAALPAPLNKRKSTAPAT